MKKTLTPALLALAVTVGLDASAASLFKPALVPKSKLAPGHLVTATPVVVDLEAIVAAGVGGTLDVALPDGRSVVVRIEAIERHDNGDLSWRGKVLGGRGDLLAIGTTGLVGSHAEIQTDAGSWGVSPAGDGHDWLFDKATTEAALPAPKVEHMDDAFRPPAGPPEYFPRAVCPAVSSMPSQKVTIDVMAVMAPDFVAIHGGAAGAETRLNAIFNNINAYNTASNVAITYRRVATTNVAYQAASTPGDDDSNALDAISNGSGNFANVAALRNFYGADMVALFRGPKNTSGNSIAGVAWLNGDGNGNMPSSHANYMFSVHGDWTLPSFTLIAHELGHNLGNAHDRPNAIGDAGSTPYAYGHYVCGSGASASCGQAGFNNAGTGFGTIMSYHLPTVNKFSSPSLTCTSPVSGGITAACGVADQQDDVRASNCVRQAVAAFKTSWVGNCTNLSADADRDGIPDCVEAGSGRSASVKDNDVFTNTLLFAAQQYRDFLAREPDAAGLNYWMDALRTGAQTRGAMVEQYFRSTEFQGAIAPVARLYFAYFLRVPDYAGLMHWIGQAKAGVPLAQVSQAFAGSAEFVNRYGALTNTQFVALVYQNVLARAPDAAGLAHWTGQLTSGAVTRGGVMLAFSESPEYQALMSSEIYVTSMYVGMLRRSPDAGGFTYWTGQLDAGVSGLGLINGFLGAAEYRSRFL